jgi:adenylyl-sulfate kinase
MNSNESNMFSFSGKVTSEERERILGHIGCVVWLTGLSASGKTTIAEALEKRLVTYNRPAYVLDGDSLRRGLCKDLGFSQDDRTENIRRVGEVAALMADAGLIVIAAFISPYRADRDRARATSGNGRFVEIYLDVPLEVCENRDPKELYRRARAGEIPEFTGISSPYEPPEAAEIVLDTSRESLSNCVNSIELFMKNAGYIK